VRPSGLGSLYLFNASLISWNHSFDPVVLSGWLAFIKSLDAFLMTASLFFSSSGRSSKSGVLKELYGSLKPRTSYGHLPACPWLNPFFDDISTIGLKNTTHVKCVCVCVRVRVWERERESASPARSCEKSVSMCCEGRGRRLHYCLCNRWMSWVTRPSSSIRYYCCTHSLRILFYLLFNGICCEGRGRTSP